MIEIHEQLGDGRRYRHDLHNLLLPSGEYCHQLSREQLFHELKKLHLAGLDPSQGVQTMSILYSRYLIDRKPKP